MKEDEVHRSGDRCGQVGGVFIPLSSNGQKEGGTTSLKGGTATLVKPALEEIERAPLI